MSEPQKPTPVSTERELINIRYALDRSAIVAITDRAGNIIHVNDRFCEISKYSREELMGQNHRVVNSGYHPREFFVEMWKTIASGNIWEGEVRNRAKDGTYYWVHTVIVPFLNDDGKPYQYVSIRFEITQRKQAEEDLKVYAEKLEVSNRELQDFASVAAHDLQEPLRKIEAFSDRLKIKCAAQLPTEGQDYLERMLSSTRRMRKLIDDLLTFSRVTTKTMPFVSVDLNTVVKDVLSDLEVTVEQARAKVTVEDLPVVEANPSQMRQLLQNLIGNAIKFRKPDCDPVVVVRSRAAGSFCELTVTDNGIGFDEKYLDRIFTIFQRLHGRHEYEGTGVGLAVCRRIVERHGGMISATSSPGNGAQFIVTLPVNQKQGAK